MTEGIFVGKDGVLKAISSKHFLGFVPVIQFLSFF